jgi:hypothetical protein
MLRFAQHDNVLLSKYFRQVTQLRIVIIETNHSTNQGCNGGARLIAFPWSQMDIPLAKTSWGRILKFPNPDPALMKQFVERHRYQALEPDAPKMIIYGK